MYIFACIGIHLVASTTLDFSNSNLTEVPPAPGNLTVTKLVLNQNRIHELQRHSLKGYTDIVVLSMIKNGLRVIHDGTFDDISALDKLYLSVNKIIKLPADFGPSTTTITAMMLINAIQDQGILTYPYFGAFTNLFFLDIAVAMIGNVNDSFYPPNIGILAMNIGTMDTFPDVSSLTPFVFWVPLDGHRISAIHEKAFGHLPRLQALFVSNNRLGFFPDVSNCTRLKRLILTNNEIPFIPRQHIGELESIEEFQLVQNKLTKYG